MQKTKTPATRRTTRNRNVKPTLANPQPARPPENFGSWGILFRWFGIQGHPIEFQPTEETRVIRFDVKDGFINELHLAPDGTNVLCSEGGSTARQVSLAYAFRWSSMLFLLWNADYGPALSEWNARIERALDSQHLVD